MRAHLLGSVALGTLLFACVGDSPPASVADAGTGADTAPLPDVSVVDAPAPSATLTINPTSPLIIKQGASLDVAITFARNGVTGPIALTAAGVPTGTTIAIAPIADGSLTTQMKITCAANATVGKVPITLKAPSVTDFTFSLIVAGPAGVLDTSFEGDGIVLDVASPSMVYRAVTSQADGKILVAGNESISSSKWVVRRYNDDGTPDTLFNATISQLPTGGDANVIAVDPKTGKIVVAGSNGGQTTVVRLNAAGTMDQSFDGDGTVNTIPPDVHFGNANTARAVAILGDSSILVAGGGGSDGYLIHYLDGGARDTAFKDYFTSDHGVSFGNFGGVFPISSGLFVTGNRGGGQAAPIAVRLLADGSPDLNFAADGLKEYSAQASGCTGMSAGATTNGEFVSVGTNVQSFGTLCELRTTTAGVGTAISSGGGSVGQMGGATAAPNGGIYVDGWFGGSQDRRGFVRRRLANGTLDPAFGTGGEVLFEDTTPSVGDAFTIQFRAITTLPDGRVVAVGQRVGTSAGPFIYRMWP